MIFRKDVLGIPFDDDYFVYAEDVYLGLRSRFAGYQVKHTNASSLNHVGSGTSKNQRNTFLTFYQERNRILNLLLFFSPYTILRVLPYLVMNSIAKMFASLIGMKYSLVGLVKAYGWFFLHVPLIMQKRDKLRKEQKVDDKNVIRYMTCKMTNGESVVGKMINSISLTYCRLVNLKTIEFNK